MLRFPAFAGVFAAAIFRSQRRIFMWVANGRIPNKTGAGKLVGIVQYGNKTASVSVPIVIVWVVTEFAQNRHRTVAL